MCGHRVSTVYVVCVLQRGSSEEQVLRSEWSAEEKRDGGEEREEEEEEEEEERGDKSVDYIVRFREIRAYFCVSMR